MDLNTDKGNTLNMFFEKKTNNGFQHLQIMQYVVKQLLNITKSNGLEYKY